MYTSRVHLLLSKVAFIKEERKLFLEGPHTINRMAFFLHIVKVRLALAENRKGSEVSLYPMPAISSGARSKRGFFTGKIHLLRSTTAKTRHHLHDTSTTRVGRGVALK